MTKHTEFSLHPIAKIIKNNEGQLQEKLIKYNVREWGRFIDTTPQEIIAQFVDLAINNNIKLTDQINTTIFEKMVVNPTINTKSIQDFFIQYAKSITLNSITYEKFQTFLSNNNLMTLEITSLIIETLYSNSSTAWDSKKIEGLFKFFKTQNSHLLDEDIFNKLSTSSVGEHDELKKLVLLHILDQKGMIKGEDLIEDTLGIMEKQSLSIFTQDWFNHNKFGIDYVFSNLPQSYDSDAPNDMMPWIILGFFSKLLSEKSSVSPNLQSIIFNNTFDELLRFHDLSESEITNHQLFQRPLLSYLSFAIENLEDVKPLLNSMSSHLSYKVGSLSMIKQNSSYDLLETHVKKLFSEEFQAISEKEGFANFIDFAKLFLAPKFMQSLNNLPQQSIELVNEVEEYMVRKNYSLGLKNSSEIITSDLPNNKKDNLISYDDKYDQVIYNNEEYSNQIYPKNTNYILGKPIRMQDSTSIGYNIHIPKTGQVESIIVEVYGGHEASCKDTKMKKPGAISNLNNYFLTKNIAVITLNLVDLLQLKVFQALMPTDLHTKLHESINYFFEQIKNPIINLHSSLAPLMGKNIYLAGSSFGGRTSIKHAELFPNTFNGYISQDGWLSGAIYNETGRIKMSSINTEIDVIKDIYKIQDPLFIQHNFDDNNVNIKVSLYFIQQLFNVEKAKLVQSWFNNKGNTTPSEANDAHNKGHYDPDQKAIFEGMAEAMMSFMIKGPSKLPEVTKLRTHIMEMLSNKNYVNAPTSEKFISEAYRLLKEKVASTKVKKSALLQDKEFQEKLDKLYQVIDYVKNINNYKLELSKLKLDDSMIDKAIRLSFAEVIEYITENLHINRNTLNYDSIKNKAIFYKAYISTLEKNVNDPVVMQCLVGNLFKANPILIPTQVSSEFTNKLKFAKATFVAQINNESSIIKSLWQQVAILVHPSIAEHLITSEEIPFLSAEQEDEVGSLGEI